MALPVNKSLSNSNTASPGELRSISTFLWGCSSFQEAGSFDVYDMAFWETVVSELKYVQNVKALQTFKKAESYSMHFLFSCCIKLRRMNHRWLGAQFSLLTSTLNFPRVIRHLIPELNQACVPQASRGQAFCFYFKIAVYLKKSTLAGRGYRWASFLLNKNVF